MDLFVFVVQLDNFQSVHQLEYDHGRPYYHSRPYYNYHQVFLNHDNNVSCSRGDLLGIRLGLGTVRRNRLDRLNLLYVAPSLVSQSIN